MQTPLETKNAPTASESSQDAAADLASATAALNEMTEKAAGLVANIQANFDSAKKTTETKAADPLDEVKHKSGSADFATLLDEIKSLRSEQETLKAKDEEKNAPNHYKAACDKYMRKGAELLGADEIKALSSGTDSEGGYTVYDEESNQVSDYLKDDVTMRRLAGARSISTGKFVQPKKTGDAAASWVGEKDARPATTAPTFGQFSVSVMEMMANPEATQTLLDDSSVNIEAWLADEVRQEFAELENAGFITGTGSGNNQPEGFLAYAGGYVDNDSWAADKIGTVSTGAAGEFGASPYDNLIDLWTALSAGYKNNGTFLMNSSTLGEILKIKDGDGNPLYNKPSERFELGSIQMKPIELEENMPDIAADSYSIAFGDFKRAYLIVDRIGIRVLRNPYINQPYIRFNTTKRVGGGVKDEKGIKLLKFAA